MKHCLHDFQLFSTQACCLICMNGVKTWSRFLTCYNFTHSSTGGSCLPSLLSWTVSLTYWKLGLQLSTSWQHCSYKNSAHLQQLLYHLFYQQLHMIHQHYYWWLWQLLLQFLHCWLQVNNFMIVLLIANSTWWSLILYSTVHIYFLHSCCCSYRCSMCEDQSQERWESGHVGKYRKLGKVWC